jgi:competence protein ComGC
MAKLQVVREFFIFLKQEKKFWLAPMVVVLLLFGLLMVFAQSSAVAPFIYTLF